MLKSTVDGARNACSEATESKSVHEYDLKDYKFFCFNGTARMMFTASGRAIGNTSVDYFDMNFNHMDIRTDYPNSHQNISRPIMFDEMIRLSEILSKDIPYVRVDWYEVKGKLYFGEMTLYHHSGFGHIYPLDWEKTFGDWIELE